MTGMDVGGISQVILTLGQSQLRNPALAVEYISLNENGAWRQKYIDTGIVCRYCRLNWRGFLNGDVLNFLKIINQYDILHVHAFYPLLWLLMPFVKAKIVFSRHSHQSRKRLNALYWKLFLDFSNRCAKAVCFVSNSTLTHWLERGVTNPNMRVVYNGVKTSNDVINRVQLPFDSSGKFVVGTCSRFVSGKRNDLLMKAFMLWAQKVDDAVLVLVGDGPEMASLRKLADELNGFERIFFLGFKDNIRDYQAIFDLAIFPSQKETFGLVCLELLALDIPVVICKDCGGMAEVMQDFPEDIVEPSPEAISKRIDEYYVAWKSNELNNPSQRAARRDTLKKFSPEAQEKAYFDCYCDVMALKK